MKSLYERIHRYLSVVFLSRSDGCCVTVASHSSFVVVCKLICSDRNFRCAQHTLPVILNLKDCVIR
jgi:hypothetical protein